MGSDPSLQDGITIGAGILHIGGKRRIGDDMNRAPVLRGAGYPMAWPHFHEGGFMNVAHR